MMHKKKLCYDEGLKHVAGTSYMTNVYLLLTVQVFGLCVNTGQKEGKTNIEIKKPYTVTSTINS
jgi:hypothetical protein